MNNQKFYENLNRIGMTCFIEHYYDFKNCENKNELAQKIYFTNPKRKTSVNITRINKAKKIFDNHLEKKAILAVINSKSPRVTQQTREVAKKILLDENL